MTNPIDDFIIVSGLKLSDITTVSESKNAMALLTARINTAAMAEAEARDNAKAGDFLGNVAWQSIRQEHHAAKTAYGFLRDKMRDLNEAEREQRLAKSQEETEERRKKKLEHRELFITKDRQILKVMKELYPAELNEAELEAESRWPESFVDPEV